MREVARTQQELRGMGTEGTGTRRQPEFTRHWGGRCWPACNQTGGSEAVGTHYSLRTHTPHLHHFFAPFLPTIQKKLTNSTLSGFSPPALNYHKQMQRRLTNWYELRFGVLSGSGGMVPARSAGIGHGAKDGHRCKRHTTEAFIKFVFIVNIHARN